MTVVHVLNQPGGTFTRAKPDRTRENQPNTGPIANGLTATGFHAGMAATISKSCPTATSGTSSEFLLNPHGHRIWGLSLRFDWQAPGTKPAITRRPASRPRPNEATPQKRNGGAGDGGSLGPPVFLTFLPSKNSRSCVLVGRSQRT